MTTLPRIRIHDPEQPRTTVIRIAFWFTLMLVVAIAVHSCSASRITSDKPRVDTREFVAEPAPNDATQVTAPENQGDQPNRSERPQRLASSSSPTPAQPTRVRVPSRTSTPARSTTQPTPPRASTPQPEANTEVPLPPSPSDPVTAEPTKSPPATGTTPTVTSPPDPAPPSPLTGTPPSNHNCDGANEGC
jgi:hypothetical protein